MTKFKRNYFEVLKSFFRKLKLNLFILKLKILKIIEIKFLKEFKIQCI